MKKNFTIQVNTLAALPAFLRIAQLGSLRAAADQLGVSPSAVSQSLRALEARLGVRLFNRTTRRVGLTEAGLQLLTQVRPGIETIAAALAQLETDRGRPSGLLRINLSRLAARMLLAPRLPDFLARYPDVRVELYADDALSDLVAGGFDAGIRLGETLAQGMVALPVTPPLREAVVGTPDYFRRHPSPQRPQDLAAHDCIRFRYLSSGRFAPWEFTRDGREYAVEVEGRLILNDDSMIRDAMYRGLGLSMQFENTIAQDLATGRLLRVLEDDCRPFPGFFIYYPAREQLPPKLRVFVDFLREALIG